MTCCRGGVFLWGRVHAHTFPLRTLGSAPRTWLQHPMRLKALPAQRAGGVGLHLGHGLQRGPHGQGQPALAPLQHCPALAPMHSAATPCRRGSTWCGRASTRRRQSRWPPKHVGAACQPAAALFPWREKHRSRDDHLFVRLAATRTTHACCTSPLLGCPTS